MSITLSKIFLPMPDLKIKGFQLENFSHTRQYKLQFAPGKNFFLKRKSDF